MQSLSDAKKFLPGTLFLLLAIFAPLHPCIVVTVEEIYSDYAGEGFKDETDLTQAEKDLISPSGNDAETLGEAREFASSSNSKVVFANALSELESALTSKEARESLQFTARDSEEARAELHSARSSLRDYSSHRQKAEAYSEVLSGESSFGAGLEREYTQAVFSDMRGQGYSDSYTARGLTDLRDGRHDTGEAEAVSGSIHRVTGLEGLVGAGSGSTRESVAAIPADGYGLGGRPQIRG